MNTLLEHELPNTWRRTMSWGPEGYVYDKVLEAMRVIETRTTAYDGKEWLHVSVSRPSKMPSYDDLKAVKQLFIGDDRYAYQVFPPLAKHVNIHNYCIHLFCCLEGPVLPDFTQGGNTL